MIHKRKMIGNSLFLLQFRSKRRKNLKLFPRTTYSQLTSVDEDYTSVSLSHTALKMRPEEAREEPT